MKIKVVFYVRDLTLGAINKVLQNLINDLDKNIFDITVISAEKKIDNTIVNNFSKEIKIKFILNNYFTSLRSKHLNKKNKKNNFFSSCVIEITKFFMNLKSIYEIRKKYDTFVDFESMYLSKYLNFTKINNKITVIHANKYESLVNKKERKKIKKKFKSYDKIVFLTQEQTNDFKKLFPTIKEKFYHIYNSFNIEKINLLSKEKFLLEDEKWIKNKEYGLMLSRLVSGKDFETVFKALAKLKELDLLSFNFYILGNGNKKNELEDQIKNLNLENHIFLLGKKENPYNWIKNSKFIIMSSYSEGLNNVVVESLILEKIIISNKFKYGAEEILLNNKYGFLFETENYLQLADILKTILREKKSTLDYFPKIKESYIRFHSQKIAEEWSKILIKRRNLC